jgi:lipopolysaccharide transport system permease protein
MRHELGFFQTWSVMGGNLWRSRELIWQLFKRDFFAAYKKSFLGLTWVFITPIIGIISWVFLQMSGMLNPGNVGIPYPAYVLVGTSIWGLFMGLYSAASETLDAGKQLVMQVRFPHEALLFKQVAQQLANFIITFALNVIILFAFKVVPSWGMILLPLVALPLFFLGAAFGLMVSMIGVVAVDISRVLNLTLGFLMFLTPVIYASEDKPEIVQLVNAWNPLTYLVCSCRDMMIYGRLYEPAGYFICAGLSFVAFLISWRLFFVSEDKIIERMI